MSLSGERAVEGGKTGTTPPHPHARPSPLGAAATVTSVQPALLPVKVTQGERAEEAATGPVGEGVEFYANRKREAQRIRPVINCDRN